MKYTDILLASVAALVFLGCDGDGVPEPGTEGNALQLRSVELSVLRSLVRWELPS